MQNDEVTTAEAPATKEPKGKKAEKKQPAKRKPKATKPSVGHVDSFDLDLEADAQQNLTFTLAPKSGAKQTITIEATGQARQDAITMLLAAKFAGKKLTVTLGEGARKSVARKIAVKSKRGKD